MVRLNRIVSSLKFPLDKKIALLISSSATIFVILLSMFQPLYGDVDNYLISLVVNSCYSDENYVIFLHPLLCVFFKQLGRVLPQADVFVLSAEVLVFGGWWVLSYLWARFSRSKEQLLIGYFCLFIVLMTKLTRSYQNFTMEAAFMTVIGMVILLLVFHCKLQGLFAYCIGIFFTLVGFMWRKEAALVGLVFLLFDLCLSGFSKIKEGSFFPFLKRASFVFLPVLLCLACLTYTQNSVNRSDRYHSAIVFNQARSNLVDYPIRPWNEVESYDLGISENDYNCVNSLIIADTDRMDTNFLQHISEISDKSFPAVGFKKGFVRALGKFFGCDNLTLLIVGVFVVSWFYHPRKELVWKQGCLLGLLFALILYCALIGRIPYRVLHAMNLCALGVLFVQFLLDVDYEKFVFPVTSKVFKVAICLFFAGILFNLVHKHCLVVPQFALFAKSNGSEINCCESNDEDFYMWDAYDFDACAMKEQYKRGKLFSDNFLRANVVLGEWTYGQKYYKEYLERINCPNPMKTLLNRKNCYLKSNEGTMNLVLNYLRENMGRGVCVRKTELVGKYGRHSTKEVYEWQFYKTSKENG